MLEVKDLNVAYGPVQAARNVTLNVARGELVSLLGSNGAGKTSTLRAISGLVKVTSGSVTIEGTDLRSLPPNARVELGLAHVPEGRRVFASLTVGENLSLGAYSGSRAAKQEHLEAVLELFPVLGERMHQISGTLSGGEQQMLAIGRALMSHPRMLMMDEPTMGLSPKMVDIILEKVREICRQGTTVFMVEQNALDTMRMSDRVYVMRSAEIVFDGLGSDISMDMLKALYLGH